MHDFINCPLCGSHKFNLVKAIGEDNPPLSGYRLCCDLCDWQAFVLSEEI